MSDSQGRDHHLPRLASSMIENFQRRLERLLYENILGFWMPRCLDEPHDGYVIAFGADGKPIDPVTKGIVTQARMLWFFSRLARSVVAETDEARAHYRHAAELGYRFLRHRMWDARHGGFFWEVDRRGGAILDPQKHLYGQSFALYGLCEFFLSSRRDDVFAFAMEVFDVLEARAHDEAYGGYIENFKRDWSPAANLQPAVSGVDAQVKLANTHLHLLEAMTVFYEAGGGPPVRERLDELVELLSRAVIRDGPIACTDVHERDWTPRMSQGLDRVFYGHDAEIIYILIEANRVTGRSDDPYLDLYRALFANALTFGHDDALGGFFDSGPLGLPADRREKVWWVQAEVLLAAMKLYALTGDTLYWKVFEGVLGFIEAHQVDWDVGEWHELIDSQGRPAGQKAYLWKAAYHNGRAVIECLETLRRLAKEA